MNRLAKQVAKPDQQAMSALTHPCSSRRGVFFRYPAACAQFPVLHLYPAKRSSRKSDRLPLHERTCLFQPRNRDSFQVINPFAMPRR